MILKQGRNDHTYKVCAINTEHALERRLEALGLTEGAFVTILNNNKKGPLLLNSGNPFCSRQTYCRTH